MNRLLFLGEETLLAFFAPAIAAEVPVFAHHAMAGNDERDGIGCAGLGNGARSPGFPDGLGNFTIRACATIRDGLQGLPDAPLESCCLYIYGEIEMRLLAVQVVKQRFDPLTKLVVVALY